MYFNTEASYIYILLQDINAKQKLIAINLLSGPTQSTISRVFHNICTILSGKSVEEVSMPHNRVEENSYRVL